MITKVDSSNIELYSKLCSAEHVFGSRCLCALKAYGTEHDIHKFWILSENGKDMAALHLNGQVLTIVKSEMIDTKDIMQLLNQFEIHEIDCDWDLCQKLQSILGGETDSSYYMEYKGENINDDFSDIKHANLNDVFSVLQQSHEYYRTHLKFEPWAENLCKLTDCGAADIYQLDINGVSVGTGSIISRDETHAAIAAVAVIPEYRMKGLGSYITRFLTKEIIAFGKTPCLISGYDRVAQLYEKLGFVKCGRWGELYI